MQISRLPLTLENPPEATPTDIWAMGITLYCFAFGVFPIEKTTRVMVLYNRIMNFKLKFPANNIEGEISSELKDFLSATLEKDPKKRITIPEMKVRRIHSGLVLTVDIETPMGNWHNLMPSLEDRHRLTL